MSKKVNAVEVNNLVKTFGSFTAVNDISFVIPEGEIFGLIGPNGAGKTTTIRMLCGLMIPDTGDINVLGFNVVRSPEEVKQRVGYMSQKFSLYNDLTAFENLNFYADIYGVSKSQRRNQIERLISMIGLVEFIYDTTRTLSGAWRQRLALACAIVHQPPMLFLDEATAGVDPVARREFWDLIYHLAGEGVSVLATTHYMDEADYCNTVGMMHEGKLIALASPDAIKDRLPGILFHFYCEKPDEMWKLLETYPEVMGVSINGIQVNVTLKKEKDLKPILKKLEASGIDVESTERVEPSLEDVFIAMVKLYRTANGMNEVFD